MENLLSQWNIAEDEKDIFRNEGLVLKKVNGKPALINPNIDLLTPFENWHKNIQKKIKNKNKLKIIRNNGAIIFFYA